MRMRVYNLNSFRGKDCFCNIISGGSRISQTGWGANSKWEGGIYYFGHLFPDIYRITFK